MQRLQNEFDLLFLIHLMLIKFKPNHYYQLFSVTQKINKEYWFFYTKKNVVLSSEIKKIKLKRKRMIRFLNRLIKRKKPIFTNQFKTLKRKYKLNYNKLIQSNNKYNLFFYKVKLKNEKKK